MAEDKPTTLLFRVPDIGFSNYAHNIPDEEIHQDKGGREEDPHVSVLVGLKNENPESVRKVVENYNLGPVDVSFGEISVFENDGYDVLKVEAEGKELRRLHRIMADELSHENRFPDYKPHVTIAYMQSGEGKKYEGDNPFEGKTVTLQKLLYSNSKETKVPIMLDMDKASTVFKKIANDEKGYLHVKSLDSQSGEARAEYVRSGAEKKEDLKNMLTATAGTGLAATLGAPAILKLLDSNPSMKYLDHLVDIGAPSAVVGTGLGAAGGYIHKGFKEDQRAQKAVDENRVRYF